MNPDSPKPSRDEIEARLTALLLGELSAEEATLLNWMIGQDAELAKLHERLKLTVDLTREAVTAEKAEAAASPTEPLKLSDARREKLLAQFKTVKPVEFVPRKRRRVSTLVAVAAVLTLIALLAAMLLPALATAKRKSSSMAAMTEPQTKNLEQLMHEEAIATGGPLPKDKVQSERPATQPASEKVNSQNVVGYVNVQVAPDSFQMLGSPTPSGDPIPATKSAEDRRRELANSIVLPQAETDADQLGTMATASEATSTRPSEQPGANAPLKLAFATDDWHGINSESLREPAQREPQPQMFYRLVQPDLNGKEVQVASVTHGADPVADAKALQDNFTSSIRPITPTTADSAIKARATKAAEQRTYGGTTSSTPGSSRGSVASGNRVVAENTPNLSDASNRGRFQFGVGYSRDLGGGSGGNVQQGGQQANTPAQVAASGNFNAQDIYTAHYYDSSPASGSSANGNKQDGYNLNARELNLGKPLDESTRGSGFTSIDSLSDTIANRAGVHNALQAGLNTGVTPNESWNSSLALRGYYDDNINTSQKSLEGTKVAGVVAGNGTTVDGTVSGPANQAGGIGGGGGRGGGGGFGGGGFGGAGGGGGGGGAAGGGRAGGRAAGRGGRGGAAAPATARAPELGLSLQGEGAFRNEAIQAQDQRAITTKYASANEVASALNSTYGTASFSVDPNTHQIIVASDAETFEQVQNVVKKLDVALPQTLIDSKTLDLQGGTSFTVQNGAVNKDAVNTFGDSPNAGRLFRSETQQSDARVVAAATPPAIVPPSGSIAVGESRPYIAGGNGQANSGTYALSSSSYEQALSDVRLTGGLRDSLPTPAKPQASPASGGSVVGRWGSFDGSTAAPVVSPSGTRISDLEGQVVNAGGTLGLNGRDTFSDGPVINNGTLNVTANNTLTRDDVGGLRYLYRSDNMVLETGNGGTPAAANPEGTFPGSALAYNSSAAAASDVLLTGGLRNELPNLERLSPAQREVVQRALEQRNGQNDNRALGFDWYLGNELLSSQNQANNEVMHQAQGNPGLADGSVQQGSSAKFRNAINGFLPLTNSEAITYFGNTPDQSVLTVGATESARGQVQSQGVLAARPTIEANKINAATLVQDGKLLMEMGKPSEAEAKLQQALAMDPQNTAAYYDLRLAIEAKYAEASKQRDSFVSQNLVRVEKDWEDPVSRNNLPVPNPMARTNLINTSKGRQAIASKLDHIVLDKFQLPEGGLPLSEVVHQLNDESKKRDPAGRGINFILNNTVTAKDGKTVDLSSIPVKLNNGLQDVRMADVLDAITKVAGEPIQYAVEDYAVVFSPRNTNSAQLFTRAFKVDTNTFAQALKGVASSSFGNVQTSGKASVATVDIASGGGRGLGGTNAGGLRSLASRTDAVQVTTEIRNLFGAMGINLDPPRSLFYNDKAGVLIVRSSAEDLDVVEKGLDELGKSTGQQIAPVKEEDIAPPRKVSTNAPIPQPEILASENNFSTFSLNVSDVSFKLAAASLDKGQLPDAASIRTEEFINAFDYRDPEAKAGAPVAFATERARYPFAHNRELLRFSIKTAAQGRQAGRPMNLVLLLDNSGSMERSDRVAIIQQALRVLASKLQPQDSISIITFARTPRLWVDGVAGDKARESLDQVGSITPEGGTNLEEAMKLAYETALRHYLANGANRVVLLTDGAANLGNVDPEALKQKVESFRKQGVALDCFGIGWEGFNDDLLEQLSSNGDGRYGFINTPEEAVTGFAGQLAGALQVAAQDVKVQVEFNPKRVTSWRQIGYAKHQLTKQQFRDNTVDAAEIAAQEAGNALYTVETNPQGEGPVATVRVRYKVPGTTDYREQAWDVAYTGNAPALDQSSPAMRLAATASAFGEWLAQSPFAQEVTPDALLTLLRGVPEICGADARPKQLETMIREAKSLAGR